MKIKKVRKESKGITLIALVITIIVLLILAGISIASLTGENGILTKAKVAKETTTIGEEKEEIAIAVNGIVANKNGKYDISAEELEQELRRNTNKNIAVTGNSTLEVEYKDTNHYYTVDGKGKIEETTGVPQVKDDTPGEFEGDGTEQAPYQVSSIEDLVGLSQKVAAGDTFEGKYFELANDLNFQSIKSYVDASRTDMGDVNKDGQTEDLMVELTTGVGFMPIGCEIYNSTSSNRETSYFDGIFDGMNHSIYNLYMKKDQNKDYNYEVCGLFGQTKNGITVKNLNIKSVDIRNDTDELASETGAILGTAGYQESEVIIQNCTVDGKIKMKNSSKLGGLVGSAWGNVEIRNCKNSAEIYGVDLTGGIIGLCVAVSDGIIEDCENYGKVTCSGLGIGGICGEQESECSVIKNCKNYAEIYGIKEEDYHLSLVAGIVGWSFGNIENCHNLGNISITTDGECIGGILGGYACYNENESIKNCYNTGNIIASTSSYTGGLVGRFSFGTSSPEPTLSGCFNKGKVVASEYVGGCIRKYRIWK